MARKSYEARREEILRSTIAVVLRKGFAATTTRDVTDEVGVARGLLHHYFPTRDSLISAAFELVAREDLRHLEVAVDAGHDPVDRLRRFVAHYAPCSPDAAVLWIDAWAESSRNEALAAITREVRDAWQALLHDVLRSGARDGLWSPTDVAPAAWTLLAFLEGASIQLVVAGTVTPAEVSSRALRLTERSLGLPDGTLPEAPLPGGVVERRLPRPDSPTPNPQA